MCKGKCKEKTRSFDTFGVCIGVTYKGDSDYKTTLGGAITILLFFILGGNLVLNIYHAHFNKHKHYLRNDSDNYVPVNSNTESWTMNT